MNENGNALVKMIFSNELDFYYSLNVVPSKIMSQNLWIERYKRSTGVDDPQKV